MEDEDANKSKEMKGLKLLVAKLKEDLSLNSKRCFKDKKEMAEECKRVKSEVSSISNLFIRIHCNFYSTSFFFIS